MDTSDIMKNLSDHKIFLAYEGIIIALAVIFILIVVVLKGETLNKQFSVYFLFIVVISAMLTGILVFKSPSA